MRSCSYDCQQPAYLLPSSMVVCEAGLIVCYCCCCVTHPEMMDLRKPKCPTLGKYIWRFLVLLGLYSLKLEGSIFQAL